MDLLEKINYLNEKCGKSLSFHQYGERTHITIKQWAVITTVSEKIL
jgi:hypothetical protein